MKILDFFAQPIRRIFDVHINKNAAVRPDGWKGYRSLAEGYHINQALNKNGAEFNS